MGAGRRVGGPAAGPAAAPAGRLDHLRRPTPGVAPTLDRPGSHHRPGRAARPTAIDSASRSCPSASAAYPARLRDDPDPPALLYARGRPPAARRRRGGRRRGRGRRRPTASTSRSSSVPRWPRPVSPWCPAWPPASTAPPIAVRCRAGPAAGRSASSAPASTSSTRGPTPASGSRWRSGASSCRRRRPASSRSPGGSRRATGSSPRCRAPSWWWSRRSTAGR